MTGLLKSGAISSCERQVLSVPITGKRNVVDLSRNTGRVSANACAKRMSAYIGPNFSVTPGVWRLVRLTKSVEKQTSWSQSSSRCSANPNGFSLSAVQSFSLS